MPDIGTTIGILVGLIGLAIAIYQGFERKKLTTYGRSQAWYIHSKANNLTGITQAAKSLYEAKYQGQLDPNVFSVLSQCEAFGIELFRETIRQIQLSEPHFDHTAIERWVAQGKVSRGHAELFSQMVVDDAPEKKSVRVN